MSSRKVHHCGRFEPVPMTRRDMLRQCAGGFGMVALGGLLADKGFSQDLDIALHHAPRAKNIIFLYMDGGPSQVDTTVDRYAAAHVNAVRAASVTFCWVSVV